MVVPARIIYTCQREYLPFSGKWERDLGVEVDHERVDAFMAEYVVDARRQPEVSVKPVGESDSCNCRLVVGYIAGLQAEGFLS